VRQWPDISWGQEMKDLIRAILKEIGADAPGFRCFRPG
jgi:hypothetical protein